MRASLKTFRILIALIFTFVCPSGADPTLGKGLQPKSSSNLGQGLQPPAATPDPLARYQSAEPFGKWKRILYVEKRFDDVEHYANSQIAPPMDLLKGFNLWNLYNVLTDARSETDPEVMKRVLAEWCEKRPNSHVAWLIRGAFTEHYGWVVRGGGYANQIPEDRAKVFVQCVQDAHEYLEKSYALNPKDPASSSFLISVANDVGERELIKKYYGQAIAAYPGYEMAYHMKYHALRPQWGGSDEELRAYTKLCREKSAQYPRLLQIQWTDYLTISYYSTPKGVNFLAKPEIWSDIEAVYKELVRRDPANQLRWEIDFAYLAFRAKKYDLAQALFDKIGDQWISANYWETLQYYDTSRQWVRARLGK